MLTKCLQLCKAEQMTVGRVGREKWSWILKVLGTLSQWNLKVEAWLPSHHQPREYVHQTAVVQGIHDTLRNGLYGGQFRILFLIRVVEADGTDDVDD